MRKLQLTFAAVLVLSLAACAGMGKSECQSADWRLLGFEDGSAGRSQARIGQYRQQCADFGVSPDLDRYRAGYAEGAEQFCTVANGFRKGRAGFNYQGTCPEMYAQAFSSAYRDGKHLYQLSRKVSATVSQINNHEQRIKNINNEILDMGSHLLADDLAKLDRIQLLADMKVLHDEKVALAETIVELQYQLSDQQRNYQIATDQLGRY